MFKSFDWFYSGNAYKKASIVPELAETNEKQGMYKGIKRFTLWTEETHETHGFYRRLMLFSSYWRLSGSVVFFACDVSDTKRLIM